MIDQDEKTDMQILTDLVGEANVKKIVDTFAGCSIYIPVRDRPTLHANIVRDYNAGMHYRGLARKYGISENWIRNICHAGRYKKLSA